MHSHTYRSKENKTSRTLSVEVLTLKKTSDIELGNELLANRILCLVLVTIIQIRCSMTSATQDQTNGPPTLVSCLQQDTTLCLPLMHILNNLVFNKNIIYKTFQYPINYCDCYYYYCCYYYNLIS